MGLLDFLKDILGFEFTSPREMMLEWLLGHMLEPVSIDIYTQDYYDLLSFILYFAVPAVAFGLFVALWDSSTKRDAVYLKQWATSAFFVLGLVALAPPVIMATRAFFNLLGINIFGVVLGPNADMKDVMALTDTAGLDLFLSIIQMCAILVLMFEMVAILAAMVISVVALIIGNSFRAFRALGDLVFDLSIKITVFGVAGNAIGLSVLAFIMVVGRLATPNDPVWRGLINVVAFLAAAGVLWGMMKRIGGKLKATVTAIKAGVSSARGKRSQKSGGYEKGGGDRQTDKDSDTHLKHSRRGFGRKRHAKDDSEDTKSGSGRRGHKPKRTQEGGKKSSERQATEPRYSSTRERLRRRGNNDDPKKSGRKAGSTSPGDPQGKPGDNGRHGHRTGERTQDSNTGRQSSGRTQAPAQDDSRPTHRSGKSPERDDNLPQTHKSGKSPERDDNLPQTHEKR